ncbi:hypothetical protein J7K43_06010 [Candidatus Calescamantes bacterium]|nr:hypothetical protein [Candidatus Calescamantes bacterium]
MKIVLDSNIVFSALLSRENKFRFLVYNKNFRFFSCNFLFVEIFKHKVKIEMVSKLKEDQLLTQLANILSRIQFIPESLIPKEFFRKAYELCKDVDESDTPFIALSMFLKAKFLTGDKQLVDSLRKKGFDDILLISEII